MLDKLAISAGKDGSLDAVLATNMLSVGVDIPRLGLMVVNGQPKGISEYIQATSRVGRGRVPGLIVAVLNKAKPRDLSHYESFSTWHTTLYRDVEATSVTPFAPRARDRALHAVLVSLIRNLVPGMLNDPPELTPEMQADIESIIEDIVYRANAVDAEETAVAGELRQLLHEWRDRNPQYYWDYKRPQQSLLQDAERAAALRAMGRSVGLAWPTMNNLRSVEPSTRFRLTERLRDPDVDGDRRGQ
jgi:superfamily II DNA or RNA helicase